jgi:hypothetical protein
MKFLIIALMMIFFSCEEAKVESTKASSTATLSQGSQVDKSALPEELEDCDDKVKEQEEKKVEKVLDLSGGDEGCTLEGH